MKSSNTVMNNPDLLLTNIEIDNESEGLIIILN